MGFQSAGPHSEPDGDVECAARPLGRQAGAQERCGTEKQSEGEQRRCLAVVAAESRKVPRRCGRLSNGSFSSKTIRSMFSSTASAASHTLAAPQREASLLQDQEENNHASHAAASSVAPPAAALETIIRVPFGDIAYGTSEWFWMPGTSDALGRLEPYFRCMLRKWEAYNCPAKASAAQWRDRVVQQRQQASLPEALAGEPLPLEQHIAAAAEGLRNEIARMTRKTARKFARAFCVPRGDKSTTQDELRKLQEATATLEDEAKKAALNLAGYRFQSRLTVFAYWCCDRRQRERKALLMSRWVEPIEEENGRCRTEVILDEAERRPQRNRRMRRQLRQLYKHIDEDFMSPYRERILRALGNHKVRYVPGADIDGTDLYEFPLEPRLTAPLHCMLCGDGFASDAALEKHVVSSHVSMAEYRKRVLFKYEERGPQAVTPSEKRNMVQNFAHFQQYSHPGAGSCVFSGEPPVPRSEAACAICARLDWKEHRVKLHLFSAPPAVVDAEQDDLGEQSSDDDTNTTAAAQMRPVVWSDGVAYLQNPTRVQELLSVERYQERWPLIPQEELHASSIQHPDNPSWRWLLHSRRVPVLPNSGALQPPAEDPDRPPCAGTGDASMPVWSCRECQRDLCGPHPKLPLNAVANDNWIGREKLLVRNASRATHMLSSLGRFCWKQVRLGRGPSSSGAAQPAEDVRQTGVNGNTIFFAQPTAEGPRIQQSQQGDSCCTHRVKKVLVDGALIAGEAIEDAAGGRHVEEAQWRPGDRRQHVLVHLLGRLDRILRIPLLDLILFVLRLDLQQGSPRLPVGHFGLKALFKPYFSRAWSQILYPGLTRLGGGVWESVWALKWAPF